MKATGQAVINYLWRESKKRAGQRSGNGSDPIDRRQGKARPPRLHSTERTVEIFLEEQKRPPRKKACAAPTTAARESNSFQFQPHVPPLPALFYIPFHPVPFAAPSVFAASSCFHPSVPGTGSRQGQERIATAAPAPADVGSGAPPSALHQYVPSANHSLRVSF